MVQITYWRTLSQLKSLLKNLRRLSRHLPQRRWFEYYAERFDTVAELREVAILDDPRALVRPLALPEGGGLASGSCLPVTAEALVEQDAFRAGEILAELESDVQITAPWAAAVRATVSVCRASSVAAS